MRTIKHKFTGEQITFLRTTEETNGELLLIEVALPPFGKGPPLHMHDAFEEVFEIMEGTLTITVGREKKVLQAGDSLTAPIGTKHTFNNEHDTSVTFRVTLTPGMLFEQSARIHYGLMEDGLTDDKGNPKKMAHTALILCMQNTLVAGIPAWIQRKLFQSIVNKAYRKGTYNGFEKYTFMPMEDIIQKLMK